MSDVWFGVFVVVSLLTVPIWGSWLNRWWGFLEKRFKWTTLD